MLNRKENRYGIPLSLFALALAVRLPFLGRADLWCDEILFVWFSTPPRTPWAVVVNQWDQLLSVTHLPLPEVAQNLFLWLCRPLFSDGGYHPFLQRLPAVLWGSFTAPIFYRLSRYLLPNRAQLGAALMVCFFLFPVYYSREAYYYAPLIFCSTAALAFLLAVVDGEELTPRRGLLFVIAATGMVYSHLTGVVFAALMLMGVLVLWLIRRLAHRSVSPSIKKITAWSVLPLLAVSPFILRLAIHRISCSMTTGVPVPTILYDAVGKFFMGSLPVFNLIACLLFAAGVVALAWPGEHATARRFLLGLLLFGALALAVSAHKTQYHVRYFSVLTPAVYLTFAAGLYGLTQLVFRRVGGTAFKAVLTLLLLVQSTVYLPLYYRLTAKGVDFGRIARWLNEHVKPGAPYLMESGYELRFVSGYFPTPNLMPACPYIHGGGPEEVQRLHTMQQQFMEQFPEAVFVESAHHGAGTPGGIWAWPHKHFRQKVELRNDDLRRMVQWGIHPDRGFELSEVSFVTDIYFNREEEVEAIARAHGEPVLVTYPAWRCVPVQQAAGGCATLYARFAAGSKGWATLRNLTGVTVTGELAVAGALYGASGVVPVTFLLDRKMLARSDHTPGNFWQQRLPVVLPAGDHILMIQAESGAGPVVQGLLVQGVRFTPDGMNQVGEERNAVLQGFSGMPSKK